MCKFVYSIDINLDALIQNGGVIRDEEAMATPDHPEGAGQSGIQLLSLLYGGLCFEQ